MKLQETSEMFKVFSEEGFFIIKNIFEYDFMEKIDSEIINSKTSKKYYDRMNKLRRIEEIFDKGEQLKNLNDVILSLLKKIFGTDFVIFKDKYNAKPPGGEGFYSHYDGIFMWEDSDGKMNKGWHKYANEFVNVLVAIDPMNLENGPLEIAKIHNGTFDELIKNTKQNGTPDIDSDLEKSLNYKKIILSPGDIVVFSSKCPHRSSKNKSLFNRRTIYYTYNKLAEGNKYNEYFIDKENSKNKKSKSLSGEV